MRAFFEALRDHNIDHVRTFFYAELLLVFRVAAKLMDLLTRQHAGCWLARPSDICFILRWR